MGNKIVQPEGWAPAKGYANGILTEGKTLYIGGQIGWNSEKIFEEKDFIGQMEQVLKNIKEIVSTQSGMKTKRWMKSPEVRELLSISPGTLQTLRINGTLPFSKIGGLIYYDYSEIVKVFEENKIHNKY